MVKIEGTLPNSGIGSRKNLGNIEKGVPLNRLQELVWALKLTEIFFFRPLYFDGGTLHFISNFNIISKRLHTHATLSLKINIIKRLI